MIGPHMTRTTLNWSELLDVYRGRSIKKDPGLKKWSNIGNPSSSSSNKDEINPLVEELKDSTAENLNDQSPPNQNDSTPQIIDLGISRVVKSELNDDNVFIRTKIQNTNTERPLETTPNEIEQQPKGKILLSELVYDTVLQDNKSIPALYSSDQPKQKQQMLSARENLLLDMLELNKDLDNKW